MNYSLLMLLLLALIVAVIVHIFVRQDIWDRLLSSSVLGTLIALSIAVTGGLQGRADFIDLAIVVVLLGWIGMLSMLRFFREDQNDD